MQKVILKKKDKTKSFESKRKKKQSLGGLVQLYITVLFGDCLKLLGLVTYRKYMQKPG